VALPKTAKVGTARAVRASVVPETLNVARAAVFLGVSIRTLEDPRWRAKHRIPASRVGRRVVYRRAELERYLERHRERFA
jgi:excisionase family DNA binding protein